MNTNEKFRLLMKELGYSSVKDFAEGLGITHARMTDVMREKQKMPEDLLLKLISNYSVNANWLVAGMGEMFITHLQGGALPPILTAREATLLENYRAAPEDGKRALEMSALAFASGIPQPVKKAKKAEKGMVQSGSHNVQIGGNVYK